MSTGSRSAPLDRILRPIHRWVWSDVDRRVRKLLLFGEAETPELVKQTYEAEGAANSLIKSDQFDGQEFIDFLEER